MMREARSFLALGLLSNLIACTPKPPPPPPPPPTPTPTPPPSLPQIRIEEGRFVPKLRGAIGCCCCQASNDAAESWPLCPREWTDAFASAGFNLTHVRLGPFSDQGYGWGMLDRIRANVSYANSKGLYVEVDTIDGWALVHQQPNLYDDDCTLTQTVPPVHYRQFVRALVHETGDLGVLYNLGNEGWRCRPSRAWEDALYDLIKQSLRDFGYPDRPVGSNYNLNQTSSPPRRFYDYVAQHGFGLQQPVVAPDGRRVPSILNESDNEQHSVQEWRDLVTATEAQPGTYVAIWRGPLSDPDWNALLASFGGRPVQYDPGRSASACLLETLLCASGTRDNARPWVPRPKAPSDDPSRFRDRHKYDFPLRLRPTASSVCYRPGPDDRDMTWELHAAATERIIQEHPWLFGSTNDRQATFLAACDEVHRVTFFSLLQAELQPRCVEVGDPFNPWTKRDSVDLSRCPGSAPQGCVYEGRHNIIFGRCRVVRGDALKNVFNGTVTRVVTGEPVAERAHVERSR